MPAIGHPKHSDVEQPHGRSYDRGYYEAVPKRDYRTLPLVKAEPSDKGPRLRMNMVAILQNLFFPLVLFAVVTFLLGSWWRYHKPGLVYFLVALCAGVVLLCGVRAASAIRDRSRKDYEPTWYVFLFLSMAVALLAGWEVGNEIYTEYIGPYYDVTNLNTHRDINPSLAQGKTVMDGGRLYFKNGTNVDRTRSGSFRHGPMYCVAPLTFNGLVLAQYDYWVVGLDCCSGTTPDFHCGSINSPEAGAGVRLMKDTDRPYYRLAVQQAEAYWNIKATHPLFFRWEKDPDSAVAAWKYKGYRMYFLSLVYYFGFNLLCVFVALVCFSKIRYNVIPHRREEPSFH